MPTLCPSSRARTALSVVLMVAGFGLTAVSLLDWISYDNFLVSLLWR